MSQEYDVAKLVKLFDTAAAEKRDISALDIVSHPISCGYLLDFCQKGVSISLIYTLRRDLCLLMQMIVFPLVFLYSIVPKT